jgi:hypothetical protein
MAYVFSDARIGRAPIASTLADPGTAAAGRSTPGHLGEIARAYDPTYGEGEFIYLKGVVGTLLGMVVTYDQFLKTTTIAPATAGKGPVAVAMSANVANQYGWYQITGSAVVLAPNAMTPGADVFMLAATPGSVDDAQVNGEQIVNAVVSTTTGTPGAGFGVIQINRPVLQGQIV